jgi:hypothetical protein
MALVFAGTTHIDFGQDEETANDPERDRKLRMFARYTRAWFDVHLKGKRRPYRTLLAPATVELLSGTWASGAFLPALGVDCADLRAGCS